MNDKQQYDLGELIIKSLSGMASESDILQLQQVLLQEPDAMDYYLEYVSLCAYLESPGNVSFPRSEDSFDLQTWQLLAEHEKTAPEIEIPQEKPQRELIQKVVYPTHEKRKMSKFSIFLLAMNTAAILLFVLFIRFAPVKSNEPIALLSRTVKAQWRDASGNTIAEGCDLYAGPMNLIAGYAEITLNEGAVVIVEAPAQFSLESKQQMYLQQGQVVARKKGGSEQTFLIRTPHASVVDYGTEFAVRVDSAGQTEAYVYEGQVQIRDSSDPIRFTKSLLLKAGQGALADTENNLRSKEVDPKVFVRPDELEIRYLAQNDKGYYRWKASIYRLHRDPSLVAHYFFEKSTDDPDWLVNEVFPDGQGMQGTFGDVSKGKPTWVQGRWPQKDAVLFERVKKQVIVIPPNEALCFTRPLTISTWFYFPNTEKWGGHLIACRDNQCINYQFSLFDKNYDFDYQQNRFEFRQYNEAVSRVGFYSRPFVPEPGKWYHAAVVYDGSELRFYVNGELFESTSYKGGISEPVPAEIIIGAVKKEGEYVLETGDFDGVIDELMLFSRDLSKQEIQAIYETGKP